METHFDCIIIGAGISGMTAAIYLKRYGYNVVLIEKSTYGGQMNQISIIENYPGCDRIDGYTLSQNIYKQVKSLNVPIIYDNVISVIDNNLEKKVLTKDNEYQAKVVILALGRERKMLGLPNEKSLIGSGISFCATCDVAFFKDEDVCVVGGGNSALEEALCLSKFCKNVTIINRSSVLRADAILANKVKRTNNINILYNSVIETLNKENGQLKSIILKNGEEIKTKGLFIYIGLESNLSFLDNLDLQIDNNSIIVSSLMETNIKGIYACGDCIKKSLYQLVTASSEGAIAASSASKYLRENI